MLFHVRLAVTLFFKLPCNRSKRQTLLQRTHPQHSVQQGSTKICYTFWQWSHLWCGGRTQHYKQAHTDIR